MAHNKIFNHDIMHCTHDGVVGNYLYCGRVLGMTEPEDLIQLHPDLQSQWSAITRHYDNIGLSHSDRPIWDVSWQKFREFPQYEPSVFIFGDAIHQSSPHDDWFSQQNKDWQDVVEFINSKNNFIRLAGELDVKVPHTVCFANKKQLLQSENLAFPSYLKPAISVDGMGINRCENKEDLHKYLDTLADDIPLQLQQEIVAFKFLNLQYETAPEGAKPLAATEQILDGFSHNGNRYPTAYQPWELVEPMAQWMASKGMKDIFAFDVAVTEPENPQYYAIECNPRFNGASYPTGIARKLDINSWSSEGFKTQFTSLSDIDLTGLEYDKASQKGVILVNWGSVLVGKLSIMLAGSIEEQDILRKELRKRL